MTSDLGPRDLASDVRRSMATTADDPVFVDTNVLVYANTVRSPLHIRAQLALQDLSASAIPLWISRQILREYLATLSRPQTFSAPVAPAPCPIGCGCRMFSFLSDLLRWFGQWSPDPAVRPTGGFQVTRRRSGTRSAGVSWTRHSAERRSPRDVPTVGGWESCGRRGQGGSGDHCPNQLPTEIVRRARPR